MNGRFVLCVKEEARNLKGEYGKSSNPPPDEGDHRGRDRMVVGFTTSYAISTNHH